MLLHMRIRILSLIATILSLGVSVLFDRIEQELLKDIFIGVFTGAILTYQAEYKKELAEVEGPLTKEKNAWIENAFSDAFSAKQQY